jgi:hypothetical protein
MPRKFVFVLIFNDSFNDFNYMLIENLYQYSLAYNYISEQKIFLAKNKGKGSLLFSAKYQPKRNFTCCKVLFL